MRVTRMTGLFIRAVVVIWFAGSWLTTQDANAQALSFDGIDDTVIVQNPGDELNGLANAVTIEAWVYLSSFPNVAPRIVDRSDNIQGAPNETVGKPLNI